jgi:general secretion pathway protein A
MYETYYHLSANPFRLTPDPKFCFSHTAFLEAYAYLQYAFELGEGLILLTGRPGAGKTTLIESFLRSLEMSEVVAARIAVTDFEATDLLRAVAYFFDIEAEGLDKATLLRRIEQFFASQVRTGRRVLLIIDEAQRLSHASLEELRLLADMQVDIRPLLQIFLAGQESLRDLMQEPDMEQLQQRVIGTCRLEPLGVVETRSYVEHRLRQASWRGDPELTGAAVLAVYEYSAGVPRHINKICTRLLLQGYMENRHVLDGEDVQRIAREFGEEQLAPLCREKDDEEAADSSLHARYQAPALAELAVRVVVPPDTVGTAIAATRRQQVANTCSPDPRTAQPSALENAGSVKAHAGRAVVYPGIRRPPARAVFVTRPRPSGDRLRCLLASVERLGERPAMLFGLVAAVTLSAGALTSLVEGDSGTRPLAAQVRALPVAPDSIATTDGDPDAVTAETVPTPAQASGPLPRAEPLNPGSGETAAHVVLPAAPQPLHEDAVAPVVHEAQQIAVVAQSGRQSAADSPASPVNPEPSGSIDSPAAQTAVTDAAALESIPSRTPVASPITVESVAATHEAVLPVTASTETQYARDNHMSDLLASAEQALDEDRLLIPAGNSAHYYYQQVLLLDPLDPRALEGIERIVARYTALATYAVDQGDRESAARYVTRGLRVRPDDKRLKGMQAILKVAVTAPAAEPAESPQALPPPQLETNRKPANLLERLKAFFADSRATPDSPEP